jgi:hypothetical protein
MAAGDILSRVHGVSGNNFVMTGQIEADSGGDAIAFLPTTKVIRSMTLTNDENTDTVRVRQNHNNSVATNGTAYVITSSATVTTWNYHITYI